MKISQEREQLEKMISQSSEKIGNEPIENISELNSGPSFNEDLDVIYKDCNKQAKKLLNKISGFLLTDEILKNNAYLKDKMQVDLISLSGLLYQIKTNELIQKTLMEEVRHGSLHPRMFEVFSQLSKTIGEFHKQLIQTTEALKMTYKDLKNDILEKSMESLPASTQSNNILTSGDGSIISRGTRDLINENRKRKNLIIPSNTSEIKDVEEIK